MDVAPAPSAAAAPPANTGRHSPENSRARLLSRDSNSNEEAHAVRMNVLNSSVQEAREARNSRMIMWVLTLVNVPQVLAAVVILALKWRDQTLCYRIQIWVLLHTIHLALTLALEWVLYYLNTHQTNRAIALRERYMAYLGQLKYGLDLAGLFWFLVGNMWVISDGARCDDGSTMYHLALWMIIIAYAKIFLPCLLLLALLPVICFCLPCVIRLLSRLQDPMRGKGATQEVRSCGVWRLHDCVQGAHALLCLATAGDRPTDDPEVRAGYVRGRGLELLHLPERLREPPGLARAAVQPPLPQGLRGRVAAGERHVPHVSKVHLRHQRALERAGRHAHGLATATGGDGGDHIYCDWLFLCSLVPLCVSVSRCTSSATQIAQGCCQDGCSGVCASGTFEPASSWDDVDLITRFLAMAVAVGIFVTDGGFLLPIRPLARSALRSSISRRP